MAQLNNDKISVIDLFLTLLSWFTLNFSAWSCAFDLGFRGDPAGALLYMGMGSLFGAMFCIDMHFYSKNGDILEKDLKELIA